MAARTYSTKALSGTRVVGGKSGTKHIGKVRYFVFHPSEKRCVGFLVKRPDLALMFRRKDEFVALDGFEMEDGRIRIHDEDKYACGRPAIKRLGLDWDRCTIWEHMPILTVSGKECGTVGDIEFLQSSGKIVAVRPDKGSLDAALLGRTVIPSKMIKGFRLGIGGVAVATQQQVGEQLEDDDAQTGAILVSDEIFSLQSEGGLAEKAGASAAIAQEKIREVAESAKPGMKKAAKATGDAVNKGAYLTGRQLTRAKGMFSAFKEEYDKAVSSDDQPKSGK